MREMISHFPRQCQKFSSETTHSCVDLVHSQPHLHILFILSHSGFTSLVSSQRTHKCVNVLNRQEGVLTYGSCS
jgi:hypothetical protein